MRTFCLPSSIDTAASTVPLPFEARKFDNPFRCSRSTTAFGQDHLPLDDRLTDPRRAAQPS
jgi:hypothetical protein